MGPPPLLRSTWAVSGIAMALAAVLLLSNGGNGPPSGIILTDEGGGGSIVVGDLDRDSRPEIVVLDGTGVRSFSDVDHRGIAHYAKVATVITRTSHLAPSDVDGDGDLDLYGANGALISSGTALRTTGQYRGGWWMGDLDGDARPDRVDLLGGNLSIDLTNIAGGSQSTVLQVGEEPRKVDVEQVDGLGGPDVLVLNGPAKKAASATAPQSGLPIDPSQLFSRGATAGDNITVLALLPSEVGQGGWARFDCPVGADPVDMGVGDFDGDKLQDLISLNRGAGTLTVRHGSVVGAVPTNPLDLLGAGKCLPFPGVVHQQTLSGAVALAVGDIDGDTFTDVATLFQPFADPDLVAQRLIESNVEVWYGSNGSLDLIPGPTIRIPGAATDVALADLSGDGAPELVVLTATALVVVPNDGTGHFEQPKGPLTLAQLHLAVVGAGLCAVALVVYASAPRVRRRRA